MAKHLARIHGTEEDRVNCPFYYKIGACRHGDRCSRLHHKPAFSQTLLFKHLYTHPKRAAELAQAAGGQGPTEEQAVEDFLCFFEDMYMELSKFGRLEGIYVADNLGDHMIGHVYVRYTDEEDAADALQVMNGRMYDGRPLQVEYSPVSDFREARCRDFDEMACQRGGFCNFLHVKPVPMPLIRSLEDDAAADRRAAKERRREEKRDKKERKRQRKEESRRRSRSRSVGSEEGSRSRKKRKSSRRHREDGDGSGGD